MGSGCGGSCGDCGGDFGGCGGSGKCGLKNVVVVWE